MTAVCVLLGIIAGAVFSASIRICNELYEIRKTIESSSTLERTSLCAALYDIEEAVRNNAKKMRAESEEKGC